MEMKKVNSGKLRAITYDARARILQVLPDNGATSQCSAVRDESRPLPRFASIQFFD